MTSVKVAVRCRPFNDREKAAKSKLIVRMEGGNTYIKNPVSKGLSSRGLHGTLSDAFWKEHAGRWKETGWLMTSV